MLGNEGKIRGKPPATLQFLAKTALNNTLDSANWPQLRFGFV
jgi:hypothetical protein